MAIVCAEHGVNFAVEKPVAISITECKQMLDAVEKSGVIAAAISQRRFFPSAMRMREAIDAGKISYAISDRANYRQVDEMLDKAFSRLPDGSGLIFHSDQGWQYQNARYQKRLLEKGVRQSMSRKGNCLDNAVMENFFGLLKSELVYLRTFQSLDEFFQELIAYLEYYNHNRIKEKLNGLSPVQYRIQNGFAA